MREEGTGVGDESRNNRKRGTGRQQQAGTIRRQTAADRAGRNRGSESLVGTGGVAAGQEQGE